MSDKADLYWVTEAIKLFNLSVWNHGLLEAAQEIEPDGEPKIFVSADYTITVDHLSYEKLYELGLKSSKENAIAFLDYPTDRTDAMPFVTCLDYQATTDLIEEISDLWSTGKFA